MSKPIALLPDAPVTKAPIAAPAPATATSAAPVGPTVRLASARLSDQEQAVVPPEMIAAPSSEPAPLRADRAAPQATVATPAAAERANYPIDLVSVLRLADGSNLQVAIAREQIQQAWAGLDAARALWLPSIRGGMNYNRHDGSIQNVNGTVVPVDRSAFFSGLGAGSVAAGSPMFPGIYSNFHLADAIFEPLAARQSALAARHAAAATTNDVLLRVSVGYLELARSSEDLAIASEARGNAGQLAELTSSYAASGQGLQSDADRAGVELALRESEEVRSKEAVQVASARLAQLLRLDPRVELTPIEDALVPIDLLPRDSQLGELVAQGLSNRPEVSENRHLVEQAVARMRREQYAVLLPSVLVGGSYGVFGGGVNQNISGTAGRFDADAVAYWELRNLGMGDAAARRGTRSQLQQANASQLATLDLVAREVVEAHAQVSARRIQIEKARRGVDAALASHTHNLDRINHGQGLPIEALQSIQALAAARREYLSAVIDFNTAQFSLYRAIGWPSKLPQGVAAAAPT